jgi:hypothetical protein
MHSFLINNWLTMKGLATLVMTKGETGITAGSSSIPVDYFDYCSSSKAKLRPATASMSRAMTALYFGFSDRRMTWSQN